VGPVGEVYLSLIALPDRLFCLGGAAGRLFQLPHYFLLLPAALLVVLRIAAFWNLNRTNSAGQIASGQESGFRAASLWPNLLR
jgi:hypothetical protein